MDLIGGYSSSESDEVAVGSKRPRSEVEASVPQTVPPPASVSFAPRAVPASFAPRVAPTQSGARTVALDGEAVAASSRARRAAGAIFSRRVMAGAGGDVEGGGDVSGDAIAGTSAPADAGGVAIGAGAGAGSGLGSSAGAGVGAPAYAPAATFAPYGGGGVPQHLPPQQQPRYPGVWLPPAPPPYRAGWGGGPDPAAAQHLDKRTRRELGLDAPREADADAWGGGAGGAGPVVEEISGSFVRGAMWDVAAAEITAAAVENAASRAAAPVVSARVWNSAAGRSETTAAASRVQRAKHQINTLAQAAVAAGLKQAETARAATIYAHHTRAIVGGAAGGAGAAPPGSRPSQW